MSNQDDKDLCVLVWKYRGGKETYRGNALPREIVADAVWIGNKEHGDVMIYWLEELETPHE